MKEVNVIFKKKIVEKMDVKIMGNVLLFHLMIQLIVIVQILGLVELIVKAKIVIISIQKREKTFFFKKKIIKVDQNCENGEGTCISSGGIAGIVIGIVVLIVIIGGVIFLIFKRRKLEKQKKQEKFTDQRSNSLQEIEIDNISTTQGFFFFFFFF